MPLSPKTHTDLIRICAAVYDTDEPEEFAATVLEQLGRMTQAEQKRILQSAVAAGKAPGADESEPEVA